MGNASPGLTTYLINYVLLLLTKELTADTSRQQEIVIKLQTTSMKE